MAVRHHDGGRSVDLDLVVLGDLRLWYELVEQGIFRTGRETFHLSVLRAIEHDECGIPRRGDCGRRGDAFRGVLG
jgi:hypothetical protein